jgi:hypothetical protein
MSSTATHFTKSFPKQADITGSPEQAFHMLDNCDKYYKYLLGGISAGTISALGTIAPGGSFRYLYASEVQNKMIIMRHQILSCHVPVGRSFFIL